MFEDFNTDIISDDTLKDLISKIKELQPGILGDIQFEEKYTNSCQKQDDKKTADKIIEAAIEGKLNLFIFKVLPRNPEHSIKGC